MMARPPKIPNGTINDSPAISAVIKQQLGPLSDEGMPSVIGLGYGSVGTMGPAWLGQAHAPFLVPEASLIRVFESFLEEEEQAVILASNAAGWIAK